MEFNINRVIGKLSERRKIFVSEADFQLELAWTIKEEYPEAKIRLEYCPQFNMKMHIDILVVLDGKWIPIELKYKTRDCAKMVDGEAFILKEHSAKDVNCYLYLKDIQRIEEIRDNVNEFEVGYTVFLTNQLNYLVPPRKEDCVYKEFSLHDGAEKTGILQWSENTGEGTKKNNESPIVLKGTYPVKWEAFSALDETKTGVFKVLINEVR